MMRDDQRADGVVGRDASGVANHVRVSRPQPEAVLEQDAGVHAGKHGNVPLRANRQFSQLKIAREFFVGFQQFVSYGQGDLLATKSPLLAKYARNRGPGSGCESLVAFSLPVTIGAW